MTVIHPDRVEQFKAAHASQLGKSSERRDEQERIRRELNALCTVAGYGMEMTASGHDPRYGIRNEMAGTVTGTLDELRRYFLDDPGPTHATRQAHLRVTPVTEAHAS
jgi:hypothetical protein